MLKKKHGLLLAVSLSAHEASAFQPNPATLVERSRVDKEQDLRKISVEDLASQGSSNSEELPEELSIIEQLLSIGILRKTSLRLR
jgi:hypothetical protein